MRRVRSELRLACAVLLILGGLVAAPAPAHAATLVVNVADDFDFGGCDPDHCSLREAMADANSLEGADTIAFAIGSGPQTIVLETGDLPTVREPVTIDGSTQPGFAGSPLITLQAVEGVSGGLEVVAGPTTIRGLRVLGAENPNINLRGGEGNVVEGCVLDGGTVAGIRVGGGSNARIGGTSPAQRNVVVSSGSGIWLAAGTGTRVLGNYIGVGADGVTDDGNGFDGIFVETSGVVIGGSQAGAGNVIAGNTGSGIWLNGDINGATIQGNLIGLAADGITYAPNEGYGIRLAGSAAGVRNVLIGGTGAGARNVVGGNGLAGIGMVGASNNTVWGNAIGVAADLVTPLGNGDWGISIEGGVEPSGGNRVGGTQPGSGNVIANNNSGGVRVIASGGATQRNSLRQNRIFHNNEGMTIDLDGDGETPNDGGDADTGPNGLQNFPLLASAVTGSAGSIVRGILNSLPNKSYTLDIFTEGFTGQEFLGSVLTTTNGSGSATFAKRVGPTVAFELVTATATDSSGNTSEMGPPVEAVAQTGPDFNGDGAADLAFGVPLEDVTGSADAGVVNVIYGGASWPSTAGAQLLHQGIGSIGGVKEAGDNFGKALATADFDEDGFDDLAVGVPGENLEAPATADLGAINVIYGSAAGLNTADTQFLHQGLAGIGGVIEANDAFGSALAAGDLNDDEFHDLAVGTPGEDFGASADAGMINVLYGSGSGISGAGNQTFFQGGLGGEFTEAGDGFGSALAIGDFNDNAGDDLAVGAPGEDITGPPLKADHGAVSVLYGASLTGVSATGAQTFKQGTGGIGDFVEGGDRFGAALATGDFDEDARADLAIGAPGEDLTGPPAIADHGMVNVIYGVAGTGLGSAGNQTFAQGVGGVDDFREAGDAFGSSLATGDITGEGADELMVGAPLEDLGPTADVGVVQVVFGDVLVGLQTSSPGDLLLRQGLDGWPDFAEGGDQFGAAAVMRDVDADGVIDLFVASPGEDLGNPVTTSNHGLVTGVVLGTGVYYTFRQGLNGLPGDFEADDQFGFALG